MNKISKPLVFLSITFLSLFILSCTKSEKEYYPNGKLKSETNYRCGKKHGPALYYFPSGKLELKMNYKKDMLDGDYEKFNAQGVRIESISYSNNLRNGKSIKYYDSGKILSLTTFSNDTLDGLYEEYYENGIARVSGQYSKGLYSGRWEYTNSLGLSAGYGEFTNGSGKQIAFHEGTGNIRVEVNYVNNEKDGEEIWYDNNNNIEKIIVYKAGKIVEFKK